MMFRSSRRQIRPVQQLEAAECGVASLAMVLDYFGASIPLDELRDLCGTSRDGNSAGQLIDTAKRLGLEACGVKLPIEKLKTVKSPLVLHWCLNHFVVLEGFRGDRATIVDPGTGRAQVDSDGLSRCYSGIALMFAPTKKLRRRPRVSPGFGRFFAELWTGKSTVVFLAVAGALSQCLGILWPALQQVLVDQVILPGRGSWLLPILYTQIGVTLAMMALSWQHQTVLLRLRTALVARLTNQLGRKLLRVPLTFIEMRSRGDLLQRVSGYSGLADVLTQSVAGIFQLLFATALAVLMLAYDAQLAAIALALDVVRILIVRRLREETRQRSAGELTARGAESSIVVQAASSGDVIQAFRMEKQLEDWYASRLEDRQAWTVRAGRLVRGTGSWLSIFDGIAQWLVFGVGGARVIQSEMTLGVFAGFLAIRGLLQAPLGGLVQTFESWLEFRAVIHRSDDIFRQKIEPSGDLKPRSGTPVLELRNVGFRFSAGSPWLFRGVSLRVDVGQNVTLVGPSGQGKSTLLRILGGVLSPTEGQVLLDGVDLRELDRDSLGDKIGAVVGPPVLVDGSLRENLRLRCPSSSDEELREATRIACFDEVVARLRSGYGTQLSGHAPPLSGGELQRLGLAQALIGRPSILLLDEATSFLDAETEARVIHNTLQARTTLISVAHRPAVIDTSDLVYRIEAGRVTREVTRPANTYDLQQAAGRIVDDRWILNNHDFQVRRGEVLHLRAPSGSGKSTLLRLIAGILEPTQGNISVFGMTPAEAGETVLYLPQSCELFETSIRHNLELLSCAPRERILQVARQTGLSRMLQSLPMGEETRVAAQGQNLSSGQRQLILLTAAFASSREVLLLDESAGQIDAQTRSRFDWPALTRGRTVIWVEHDGGQ